MKKLITLILTFVLALASLAGCGQKNTNESTEGTDQKEEAAEGTEEKGVLGRHTDSGICIPHGFDLQ